SQPQFPTPATRWGLAATAGAHHRMHTNANSFSTYIQVKTGMKLWIVACPKGSDFANFANFLNIIHFHDSDGLDNPDLSDYKDQYRLEAMLLLPGSQLNMHPGTPHTVITITPSICHGGHCYAASTIQETCISFMITFVANSLLTNTDHT
ncbi:hypothetical protein L208DRAFT_1050222, partial [Tricholoma matsutake]